MNKIRLPKKVKVGSVTYDILFPYIFIDSSGYLGLHEKFYGLIKLVDIWDNKPLENQGIACTFIHELFHAIDFVYLSSMFDEFIIDKISKTWMQVLLDNDLRLNDENYIPEKFKLGGFTYSINYPYEFVDADPETVYKLMPNNYTIFLSGDEQVSTEFLKFGIVLAINARIFIYCLRDYEKYDDILTSRDIDSFGNGVFQVFKDCKMESIIKKYCIA